MPVQAGTKRITVSSDIEIKENGVTEIVIDTKAAHIPLNDKEVLQSISYAKLVSTPPAIYGVVTNGIDIICTNIYTGKKTNYIPTKNELVSEINRTRRSELSDIEIRELNSLMLTLNDSNELYRIIKECKDIIEKRGLIRSDKSFKEMTKILLVKMNEEKRAKNRQTNRFQTEVIEIHQTKNKTSVYDVFQHLFAEAHQNYPIFSNNDSILIKDDACLKLIIEKLEPWSFLGTGDDIKGSVYEIFLKTTLRGDFDQYFTPREVVEFIVKYANPRIGDLILDPACGSGGFLIQSFLHVNQQIVDGQFSEKETREKFDFLIHKCLWGGEADEDLHVLAKINLIMHGDGFNNIYQGDSLKNTNFKHNQFDVILTNPPFTIPYEFKDVLDKYELGLNKDKQELDILFVELCLRVLKPNGDLYIVLPEGILNLPVYQVFRTWLMEKCYLTLSISLPEGAFIPFGKSVSKTAILGIRKKGDNGEGRPNRVFLGIPKEIGYEVGKAVYKKKDENDLLFFMEKAQVDFSGIRVSSNDAECAWIDQDDVNDYRIDAGYLINKLDQRELHQKFTALQPIKKVCKIEAKSITPKSNELYNYIEIPDITPTTGSISNVRKLPGSAIGNSFYVAHGGDLVYCRINPRKNRVFIIPEEFGEVLVSKEAFILKRTSEQIISNYVLAAILQSDLVRSQLVRLSTGSSSSRARVQDDDFLNSIYIPIPDKKIQKKIHDKISSSYNNYWKASQKFLSEYVDVQQTLLSNINKDTMPVA